MPKDKTLETWKRHTIVKGDTLWDLSYHYYRTGTLWHVIQEANPEHAERPRALPIGKVLDIPTVPAAWRQMDAAITRNRNNYQVYAPYRGGDEEIAESPFLIPPLPAGTRFKDDIPVEINGVLLQVDGLEEALGSFENQAFRFALSAKRTAPTAPRRRAVAQATLKGEHVWNAGPDAQALLENEFSDFCNHIEHLELEVEDVLVPGSTSIILGRVAEALPATLRKTLLYRYGFHDGLRPAGNPYVDLEPGMRLRVEYATNQFVEPGSLLNGPVGAGQGYYEIGMDTSGRIVFDPFLGAMATPQINMPDVTWSAAGLVDLQAAGASRRHYRMFYPTQMPTGASRDKLSITQNLTLIAADTLPDLVAATETYLANGATVTAAVGNAPILYFTFRGQNIAVPEIGVHLHWRFGSRLQEEYTYVPLGTTVRQLLDRATSTWNPGLVGGTGQRAISLQRFFGEADGLPEYRPVIFNPMKHDPPELEVYDLPLVKGDIFELRM